MEHSGEFGGKHKNNKVDIFFRKKIQNNNFWLKVNCVQNRNITKWY